MGSKDKAAWRMDAGSSGLLTPVFSSPLCHLRLIIAVGNCHGLVLLDAKGRPANGGDLWVVLAGSNP